MKVDEDGNWYHDDCVEDLGEGVKTFEAEGTPPPADATCAVCDEPLVEDDDASELSEDEQETIELPEN